MYNHSSFSPITKIQPSILSCKIHAVAGALTQLSAYQLYSFTHLIFPYVTGRTMQLVVPCNFANVGRIRILKSGCPLLVTCCFELFGYFVLLNKNLLSLSKLRSKILKKMYFWWHEVQFLISITICIIPLFSSFLCNISEIQLFQILSTKYHGVLICTIVFSNI